MTEVRRHPLRPSLPDRLDFEFPALSYETNTLDGTLTLATLLKAVKEQLPYLFRYEQAGVFTKIDVDPPQGPVTAHRLLALIASHLPPGWQITALPGYVIMYPKVEDYPSGSRYYRGSETIYSD